MQQPLRLGGEHGRECHALEARPPGLAIQIAVREAVVLRREMPVNAILDARALPDQERAAAEELPAPACVEIGTQIVGSKSLRSSSATFRASTMSVFDRACQISLT